MKHIVFIAGSYYPYYSAVGKCLGNVVEELEKDNRVTVVCFKSKMNQVSKERYSNHDIVRVYTKTMYKRNLLEKDIEKSKGIYKKIAKFNLSLHKIIQAVKAIFSRETIQKQLVNEYLKALEDLDHIDILIPTCNPFDTIMGAMEFKNKHKNVNMVPFLFDKFSTNNSLHRLKLNRIIKMNHHLSLEKKMLKNSKKVLFVESWKEHLQKNFPEYKYKYCLVEHPLVKLMNLTRTEGFFESNKINIVYTGVVSKTVRSPEYTLRLFSQILNSNKDIVIHFYVLGNAVDIINEYSRKFPGQIINHGEVSTNTAHQAMINSSYLLSIGNNDITQVPSKIFEYMSCCKPIIHTCVDKNDPANFILQKYPSAIYIEQRDEIIDENVQKLNCFLTENTAFSVEFAEIEKAFFNALPRYSADAIVKTHDTLS